MTEYDRLRPGDFARNDAFYRERPNTEDAWYSSELKSDAYWKMLNISVESGVSIRGSSCLDVGCGTGDLSKILRKLNIREYLGVDIYKPSLVEAKKKYPKEDFVLADILTGTLDNFRDRFDYVFASGVLTNPSDADNYDYMRAMLSKMWEFAGVGLAFNFLFKDIFNQEEDKQNLFYYDESRVNEICKEIDPNADIHTVHDDLGQLHMHMIRPGLQTAA